MPAKKTTAKPIKYETADALMQANDHPLKNEINVLREIISGANAKISERIKWNAPSYFYIKDMAAFNLHQEKFVQIIFIFYNDTMLNDDSGLLEGKWKDRREMRFYSIADINSKKKQLEKVINEWVDLAETFK